MAGGNETAVLKGFADRVEKLEDEKSTIGEDIKEIFKEAKAAGFNTTILKKAIRIRMQDRGQYKEEQDRLEEYLHALGVLD